MRRLIPPLALLLALPLLADDRKKPDNKEQVGTDQVTVYWCTCIKEFWTQPADDAKRCPKKGCEEHPKCGDLDGDYKIVVRALRDSVRAKQEVAFDVEVYQIVIDKDSKPDEVLVTDITSVKARFTPCDADGNPKDDEAGPVIEAKPGAEKVHVLKNTFAKKGEQVLGIEIVRGNKTKTTIESEIRFTVD